MTAPTVEPESIPYMTIGCPLSASGENFITLAEVTVLERSASFPLTLDYKEASTLADSVALPREHLRYASNFATADTRYLWRDHPSIGMRLVTPNSGVFCALVVSHIVPTRHPGGEDKRESRDVPQSTIYAIPAAAYIT